jgi:transcriptional regulator with GAF, ATPase, and Fis domain
VLLPAVLLHFYLIFPQRKEFLRQRPKRTLALIYGVPLAFLTALLLGYVHVLWLLRGKLAGPDEVERALLHLRVGIYLYLGIAGLWYLASVICLLHSYQTAKDGTERNQVKCILFGSVAALVPIGYTLSLAVADRDAFAAGAATWPMFAASVCFTVAFAVGITRYRLMQLDQLISSGARYFLISFLAGLVYYALVFACMVAADLVGTPGTQPSLPQSLWVGASVLVLMVLLNWARGRLMKVLDRRFYREKYQLDRTLRRMGQAIEQLVDPPTLARRLLQASTELLGTSSGAVYLREGEPPLYRLAGHLGAAPALNELSSGCPLVERLQARGALAVSPGSGPAAEPAQRQLRLLGGAVAQALAHEDQVLALLVLGPRPTGDYGTDDLNLLAAFAQITALALKSAEGHRTIEVLNHDLRAKVEKISEQQHRILALQSQLQTVNSGQWAAASTQEDGTSTAAADGVPAAVPSSAYCPPPTAPSFGGIVGSSPPVRQLLHLVRKVAASPSAVLLRGESGTGKELLARAIHDSSPRAGKAFVTVHCTALSAGLLESELFGHVKGAFTGAHRDKVGRFELANGGTLFLDEIGDISLEVQTKLLRVLQETAFERVGSSESVKVNVRLIAATHQDLEALIRQGRFREDLYYRLNVIPLQVPPLRERREDIAELAQYFLRQYSQRCGKAVAQIDDDALLVLKAYSWPGNVRQLENVLQRVVVLVEGPVVMVRDLPEEIRKAVPDAVPGFAVGAPAGKELESAPGVWGERSAERDQRERESLVRALAAADGNKARAARALGVARSTLVSRLKKHGLS